MTTLPPVDAVTAGFWDATRRGVLAIQHCRRCGHWQHHPRALCTSCGAVNLDFEPASGTGTLYSFSVVHRSPDPVAWPPPYVIALVRLTEGPTLLTHLVGVEPEDLRCDMALTAAWRPLTDGRQLIVFSTADGGA